MLKYALQTSRHLLTGFIGPSCGSRVDVSDQTAVSKAACPGWLDVLASAPMAGDLPSLWAVSLSLPWLPSVSSQSPRDPAESDWKRSYVHPLIRGHTQPRYELKGVMIIHRANLEQHCLFAGFEFCWLPLLWPHNAAVRANTQYYESGSEQ